MGAQGEVRTQAEEDVGGGGVEVGVGWEWGGWLEGAGSSRHHLWSAGVVREY